MKLLRTRGFKITLGTIFLGIVGYFAVSWYLTQKLERLIASKLPEQIEVSYEDLRLSLLYGSVTFNNFNVEVKDSTAQRTASKFHLDRISVHGLGYFKLYRDQEIQVDVVSLLNPSGTYRPSKIVTEQNPADEEKPLSVKAVSIGKFEIKNAQIGHYDNLEDSLKMRVQDASILLKDLKIDIDSMDQFNFHLSNYEVTVDSLFYRISAHDNLQIDRIEGTQSSTNISNVWLYTHPNTKELSRMIPKERDHYNLKVDTIEIHDISLFEPGNSYFFKSKLVDFKNLELAVYRDKLIRDDYSIKPMTSEMLREIPFPFHIDSVSFGHNKISYQERVHDYNDGGVLFFGDGHVGIDNLSNTSTKNTPTTIYIDTKFMGNSPIKAKWTFSAHDVDDGFRFTGNTTGIRLSDVNSFSAPNLNATMQGNIEALYFDFYGNAYQSEATVKASFNDVEIAVMDRNNSRRNKFYSSLANLIVKNSSKTKKTMYQEAKVTVERDRTKSQFNFIYLNLKESLMKVLL